jgi:hypothetical protein
MFLASQFSVSDTGLEKALAVQRRFIAYLLVQYRALHFGGFRQIHAPSHQVHFSVALAGQRFQCLVKHFVCFYSLNVRAFERASAGFVQSLCRRGVHDGAPWTRFVRILRFTSVDAFVCRLASYGTATKQRCCGDCNKALGVGHSVSSLSGLGV